MTVEERAIVFDCGDDELLGIISRPRHALPRGVLIVVGGPQYRAGSHRQFTLLCRALADREIAAMRFDYRGMGDSSGGVRNFEDIQDDIRAAVDQFVSAIPELREIVIWGLCDAASAAMMYAHRDKRISGLVLLNPWVRTQEGLAKVQIKYYYRSRLADREFWKKILSGRFDVRAAVRSSIQVLATAFGKGQAGVAKGSAEQVGVVGESPLPNRMAEGLSRFTGKVLLILSGNDLTAREFEETVQKSPRWRGLVGEARVEQRKLLEATHTFSSQKWRDQVAAWTIDWVRSW